VGGILSTGEFFDDTVCLESDTNLTKVTLLRGGHRLGENFEPIFQKILREVK
jgi:type IV secretory pathway VirJ component